MAHEQTRAFFEPHIPFEQEQTTQQQPPPQPKPLLFHPIYKDIYGPLYEETHHNHNQPSQPQESQPNSHSQSQHFESLFPSYEEIEASLWNNLPNSHEEINDRLDNLYAFKSMLDNHLHQAMEFQTTLLASIINPTSTQETATIPPPQPSSNDPILPNPRHGCSHCERTAKIIESIKIMLHQIQDETRFALHHILKRLDALSLTQTNPRAVYGGFAPF